MHAVECREAFHDREAGGSKRDSSHPQSNKARSRLRGVEWLGGSQAKSRERERVSVQGVGVGEIVQAEGNAIHWATKLLAADVVVVIVAGTTKIARSSARARAKDLFMIALVPSP